MSSSIAAKALVSKPTQKVFLPQVRARSFDQIAPENSKLSSDSKSMHEAAQAKNLGAFVDAVLVLFGNSSNEYLGLLVKRLGDELSKGTFDDPKFREIFLDLIQKNPDAIDSLPKVIGNLVRSGVPTSSLSSVASRAIRRSKTLCPVDVSQTLVADLKNGEYSDLLPKGIIPQISQALFDSFSPTFSPQNTSCDPVVSPSASTPFPSPVSEGIVRIPLSISAPANSNSIEVPSHLVSSPVASLVVSSVPRREVLSTTLPKPTADSLASSLPISSVFPVELVQIGSRKSDSILLLPRPIVQPSAVALDSPSPAPVRLISNVTPSAATSTRVSSYQISDSQPARCTNQTSVGSSFSPIISPKSPTKSDKKKAGIASTTPSQAISFKKLPKSKSRPSSKVSLLPVPTAKKSSKLTPSTKKSKISLDKKPLKKAELPIQMSKKSKNKKLIESLHPSKVSQKKSIQNTRPLKISHTSVSKSKKSPKTKVSIDLKKVQAQKTTKKNHPEKQPSIVKPSSSSIKSKKSQKPISKKKKKAKIDSEMDRQKLLRRKKAKRKIVLALLLSKKKKNNSKKIRL